MISLKSMPAREWIQRPRQRSRVTALEGAIQIIPCLKTA